ncbi:MAG TPA: cysteine peptidase family C39 domain-containing protein [Longimicrobiaceae bacterium]
MAAVPVARVWAWSLGGEYLGRDGVRLQQGDSDCAVAALTMILERHGRDPQLEGVRRLVQERRSGLTLLEMQAVAGERGLRATGWRLDLAGLARAPLPAIAHFEDHYVVVDRVEADGTVRFRDPSLGRLALPAAGFRSLWTGNVLVFSPPAYLDNFVASSAVVFGKQMY